MCGINGIFHFNPSQRVDLQRLTQMRDSINHRGPDGSGIYTSGNLGFGHRRLSILDLSEAGHQPFISQDGRYSLVFNGEIFNYLELKEDLKKEGYFFSSSSDTEVLLALFIKEGLKCLDRLNGMFAFAVWDDLHKKLYCARDRVGVKPLYYAIHDNSFFFASEHKALFAAGVPREINYEAMDELFLFRYIAGKNTIYSNVFRLEPGHSLVVENGRLTFQRWWNLADKIVNNRANLPKNPFDWFEEVFTSSVKYRTISDVPVGIMLSGGLDSGSIAVALSELNQKHLSAFTVGFDENAYNEAPLALEVCNSFGLEFNLIKLEGENLFKTLEDATGYQDEPLVHQNEAQMLALSRVAKSKVSVLLSGEGGDELMGGYVRYKPLKHHRLIRFGGLIAGNFSKFDSNPISNRLEKLNRYVTGNSIDELVKLNASNIFPSDLLKFGVKVEWDKFSYRNKILDEAKLVYSSEPARQAMYCDIFIHMASILDRNDRMTMGAGIECRTPFMDYRLLEMLPALSSEHLLKGNKGKYLLCQSIANRLPKEVKSFKKLGFSVPWDEYFTKDKRLYSTLRKIELGSLNDLFPTFRPILNNISKKGLLNQIIKRQLIMVELWKSNQSI